ncbi:hypothetical protein ACTXT7_012952 [Hymenolepis weldensis]
MATTLAALLLPAIFKLGKISAIDIVKHTAWLNNFEGTLIIRTLGPDKFNWKPIIAELAATESRNFLLDIPYWYAKDFLVLDTHLLDLTPFKIEDGASIFTFSIVPSIGQYKSYGRGPFVEALRPEIYKRERARRYSDILPFLPAYAALTYDAMLLLGVALLNLKDSISVRPGSLTCERGSQASWPDGEKLIQYIKSGKGELGENFLPKPIPLICDRLFDSSSSPNNCSYL